MITTGICRWLFLLISLSTWTKLIDSKEMRIVCYYTNWSYDPKTATFATTMVVATLDSKEMRIVCYYTNWSVYRPGQAKFSPQNINPYLCTHLVYAFGGFTKENTLKPFDKYQDIEKGGYAKFTGLKTYNKNLKTLIAIGGWNEGSSRFSPMVASAERRKELVKNAIKFLRQNHFDGLDLDWEYPTFRDGGKARDRDNYAQLVQELREEFERESEKTGRPRLLLTMAVPAGIEYINKGYDVPKLTKYLDWMNILSYDYHSAFEPAVNHHAPLYSLEEDNEYNYDAELNIDYTIKHYLKMGADPNKLVLGIPTYGRSYTLFNPEAFEIGSPADGPGDMGEATRENGYLAYYEICDYVKNQDWEVDEPNLNAMGPIAFKGNQWVGYDDQNIVKKKAEYVVENGLGGIMFWAIDNDDFRGNCHGKPYPLIEAGKEAMVNAYGLTEENLISPPAKPTKTKTKPRTRKTTTTSTEKPEETSVSSSAPRRRRIKAKTRNKEAGDTTAASTLKRRKTEATSTYSSLKIVTPAYTTPEPPATPDMGGAFKCEDEGFFPHPKDCKKYYWCLSGAGDTGIVAHQFTCPAGLYFNKAADSCDYSQNVFCNKKLQKATTTTTTQKSDSEGSTSSKPTTNSIFSSTRAPPKITAATSKTTINFRATTSTTTEAPEEDEEYEYEDEDEEAAEEPSKKGVASEEDPKVIKELIDLIRKAGGIEELEKQLKFASSTSTLDATTASPISKSLIERVLSKTNKNTFGAFRKNTANRNSGGPQGSGDEQAKEKVERGRPQYRTLTRQRPSTEAPFEPETSKQNVESSASNAVKSRTSSLEYVNIRRPKVSTTTEASDDDGFDRNKILGEVDSDQDENTPRRSNTPQYVNIRRQRPTTTESPTTSFKYFSIRRSTTVSSVDPESDTEQAENYSSHLVRRGYTTTTTTSETPEVSSLRYQTIRRGTTTTPSSTSEATRRRTTTEAPGGTTTVLPEVEEEARTTLRYHAVSRETTIPTTSTSSQLLEASATEESSTNADLLVTTQESATLSSIKSESIVTSTQISVTESINSTLAGASSDQTETKKKRPLLFQPRPSSSSTTTSAPSTSTKITVVTRQSPFRVGYRRRPGNRTAGTTERTTAPPPSTSATTKTGRRRLAAPTSRSRSTTFRPPAVVESQATSTSIPSRTTSRFKFVSRKPYSRFTTTTPQPLINHTDQNYQSSNRQSQENKQEDYKEATDLGDIALALQKLQQAPAPSTKRPQVSRTNPSPKVTTSRPSFVFDTIVNPSESGKKTLAISIPFLNGFASSPQVELYTTPQSFPDDGQFRSTKIAPSASFLNLNEIYNIQSITAQDFVNKYTASGSASTRAGSRYVTSTEVPVVLVTPARSRGASGRVRSRGKPLQPFEKMVPLKNDFKMKNYQPVLDYDYYDSVETSIVGNIPAHSKVLIHANGIVECLDQGNFPHPLSCKKFISCAKMDTDKIIGWEYTCPKNLSFDPIGGMCNWSAGLGCNET